jgi:hypothetical protein
MEPTLEAHFSRVKRNLLTGRKILEELRVKEPMTYNVPNAHINYGIRERPLPLAYDA